MVADCSKRPAISCASTLGPSNVMAAALRSRGEEADHWGESGAWEVVTIQ